MISQKYAVYNKKGSKDHNYSFYTNGTRSDL